MAGYSGLGTLLQDLNGGQYFAFDKLKERTTSGRNVGDLISDAIFIDGREGIATTGNRKRRAFGNRLGQGFGAFAELIELEHAHRAVPQNSLGRFQQVGEMR